MPRRYFIIDQSALDEIGSCAGQIYEDVVETLEGMLEDDQESLDNIVIIHGDIIQSVTKLVISFDDSNKPS